MRNVWRDDFMGYWGVVMQDRGYELPRILILETVWKVGWRGVNEARSLACNAKIRSPCPSMLASVAPVWCPSGLSRQSLEVVFSEVQHSLGAIPMSLPDSDLRPWGYYSDCDLPATRRWL